ncbi:MAG TPA: hypothetical protein VGD50_05765 [Candidatus Baltobacteraceae bacterium]
MSALNGVQQQNAAEGILAMAGSQVVASSQAMRRITGVLRHPQSGAVACNDSSTATFTLSNSVISFIVNSYYDVQCTELGETVSGTYNLTNVPNVFAANAVFYDLMGQVTGYEVLNGEATTTAIEFAATDSLAQGGAPLDELGLTCSLDSTACGFANIINVDGLNESFGVSAKMAYALSLTSVQGEGVETFSTGPLNGLSLAQGSGLLWGVTGGSVENTVTIAVTEALNGSERVTSTTVLATDAADDAAANLTVNADGSGSGTISQKSTGKVVATFSFDSHGDGTISYSDGSGGTISGYVLVS